MSQPKTPPPSLTSPVNKPLPQNVPAYKKDPKDPKDPNNPNNPNNPKDPKDLLPHTHRVKHILEKYNMHAGESLTGPTIYEEMQTMNKGGQRLYNLPPDVELSKTSSPDENDEGDDKSEGKGEVRLKEEGGERRGRVTLSRIDDPPTSSRYPLSDPSQSYSPAYPAFKTSHLSGDMIRRIRMNGGASQKESERHNSIKDKYPPSLPPPSEAPPFKRPHLSPVGANPHPTPVMSTRDVGHADIQETLLAGEKIACFSISGEMRLCLPQILNTALHAISLQDINNAVQYLWIHCSRCSDQQLQVLKRRKIVPDSAAQCGLITKSDAERLCATLLERHPPRAGAVGFNANASPFSFRVQHECFGKCYGVLLPEACTGPSARCIECLECEGIFSPQRFVCHAHRNAENKTCHWGFDSANWRSYLHLWDEYSGADKDKLEKRLQDFKNKFPGANVNGGQQQVVNKRKQSSPTRAHPPSPLVPKKPRLSSESDPYFEGAPGVAPPPSRVAPPPGVDPYLYLSYQQWARSGALGQQLPHGVTPAALANMAQAIKDGKTYPPYPRGVVAPPPSGSLHSPQYFRRRSSASPPPQQPRGGHKDQADRIMHQLPANNAAITRSSPELPRPSSFRPSPLNSKTSLAEDIESIRHALEGASPVARERTLKILERLTARLALAESERDMAVEELLSLQKRYHKTEDELQKKRSELRELLRQDSDPANANSNDPQPARSSSSSSAVTLELLTCTAEGRSSSDSGAGIPKVDLRSPGLPKVDLRSPAQVIESKEQGSRSSSVVNRMNRTGTPASTNSKDSEDLQDRMRTIEAQLRAVQQEFNRRKQQSRTNGGNNDEDHEDQ